MDATRGPIVFRCDGTPQRGWEPLYQCLSLAAALQRRRRGTHFFSYLDPLSLADEAVTFVVVKSTVTALFVVPVRLTVNVRVPAVSLAR